MVVCAAKQRCNLRTSTPPGSPYPDAEKRQKRGEVVLEPKISALGIIRSDHKSLTLLPMLSCKLTCISGNMYAGMRKQTGVYLKVTVARWRVMMVRVCQRPAPVDRTRLTRAPPQVTCGLWGTARSRNNLRKATRSRCACTCARSRAARTTRKSLHQHLQLREQKLRLLRSAFGTWGKVCGWYSCFATQSMLTECLWPGNGFECQGTETCAYHQANNSKFAPGNMCSGRVHLVNHILAHHSPSKKRPFTQAKLFAGGGKKMFNMFAKLN